MMIVCGWLFGVGVGFGDFELMMIKVLCVL